MPIHDAHRPNLETRGARTWGARDRITASLGGTILIATITSGCSTTETSNAADGNPTSVEQVDPSTDLDQASNSSGDTGTGDLTIVDYDTMEIVAPPDVEQLLDMPFEDFMKLPDSERVDLAAFLYKNPFYIDRDTYELTAGWTPDAEIDNQYNPLINPGTLDDSPEKILGQINFAAKAATAQINQGSAQLDVDRAIKAALFEFYRPDMQDRLMKDADGRAALISWIDTLRRFDNSNLVPLAPDYELVSAGAMEQVEWLGLSLNGRFIQVQYIDPTTGEPSTKYEIFATLAEDPLGTDDVFSRWTVAGVRDVD